MYHINLDILTQHTDTQHSNKWCNTQHNNIWTSVRHFILNAVCIVLCCVSSCQVTLRIHNLQKIDIFHSKLVSSIVSHKHYCLYKHNSLSVHWSLNVFYSTGPGLIVIILSVIGVSVLASCIKLLKVYLKQTSLKH